MTLRFKPNFSTTGIGSVPFTDSEEAVTYLLDSGPGIPFWPQLPKRCFEEEMIPQYGLGMPCVQVDGGQKSITFDPANKMSDLEAFYHKFLEEDPSLFALSEESAAGLAAFQRMAGTRKWPIVKGQTTGPITMSTGIPGPDKRPIFSDPELRDAVVKTLVRQVQWQIQQLKPYAEDGVLIFVDEPVLAAFGSSSYLYLSEEIVHEMLGEVFEAISDAGGISGIHVCGNSDFGMIARSGVQVINFDAYQYGESISLYPDEIKALFDCGGSIAWGIVPTTPALKKETVEGLIQRFQSCLDAMEKKGFSKAILHERAILTPSCGAGNLTLDEAKRVFELLAKLKSAIQK